MPVGQLLKLADWFDGYRTSLGLVPGREEYDEDLTPDMVQELERRFCTAPGIRKPPGTAQDDYLVINIQAQN